MRRVLALLLLGFGAPAPAQEFAGLDVGQPVSNTLRLGVPVAAEYLRGYRVQKWIRPNMVELSVTAVPNGPIVYMESFPQPAAPAIPGEGLRFRVTTMAQAVQMLGAPGFYFTGRGQVATFGSSDISYSLRDRPQVIVTFAFAAPTFQRRYAPDGSIAENPEARLDSMIVADYAYQLSIWGGQAVARPGYQLIALTYH